MKEVAPTTPPADQCGSGAPGTGDRKVGSEVADAIPKARYELVTGPGASHGLHIERPEDLLRIVTDFLDEHWML